MQREHLKTTSQTTSHQSICQKKNHKSNRKKKPTKMACRKLISSANKLNLTSVRSFATTVRTFSSEKKDELAKVTHTGQVSKFTKKIKIVTQTFDI